MNNKCDNYKQYRLKSTTQSLIDRVQFTDKMHSNSNCTNCSLCSSNMVIFPEGTTTNGNDLLMFRTGVFNSGLPIQPVIIKCKWKHCNTTWETIHFRQLTYKVMTQFVNHMEVIIAPPYIPTEQEKEDSLLYAYNMNILMAQMMALNNENRKPKIYLLNRDLKVSCWHHHFVLNTPLNEICKRAKKRIKHDPLIAKYLKMLQNDDRYLYDGEDLVKDEQDRKQRKLEMDKDENKV